MQPVQSRTHSRIPGPLALSLVLLCLILAGSPSKAVAQSLAGLGGLNGSVEDPQGGVIAKANVEVTNSSLGIDRKIATTDAGLFSAPSLPPAPGYVVTVTAPGFDISKTENIVVHVGEVVEIPVKLALAGQRQDIIVSGSSAPILDFSKTEVSDLINEDQINNLPINGRRADEFALLAPGVVPDTTSGEVSFHGVPSGNLFLLDGVDITQQWFIQNAGGDTSILSNISMDAVQEFRTELLGYSAEFGRGAGGVINLITRSGTNQFHGGAFWYYRNQGFNATDLFSKLLVNGVSTPYNPPESRQEYGGTVGGPIIKDKLFFFSSYEGTFRNFPVVSSMFSESSSLNTTTGQLLSGQCNATAAQCAAVQTFINRLSIPSTVARNLHQNAAFVKFDYRPSVKSTYSAHFNLVNYTATHDGTSAAATTDGTGASGENYNVGTHVRNAHLANTYLISPSMVNEARFGFSADRRFQGLPTDLAPPDGVHSELIVNGISTFGVSLNQLPNIQPTEKRFDFSDNLSQSKGKHQLKYGIDLAYLRSVENAVFSGPGAYTYSTFTNFAYDLTPESTDPVSTVAPYSSSGKHYTSFAQAVGHPQTRITIRDYDFFAQDLYQLTPSLALNLGVRYEYATYTQPPPPTYQATNSGVGKINQPKADFAPRIGFSYAMNNSQTVVRGSYGIFYNRLPGATITRLQQLGGSIRKSFTLGNGSSTQFPVAPVFPNTFTSLSQVNSVLNPSLINSGFAIPTLATPYVQEWTLGVEHALTKNMSLNLAYIGSRGVKFIQRSDLNAGPPTGTDTYAIYNSAGVQTGSFATPVYFNTANGNTTYNSNYSRVLQIDNGGRLWYDGLIVEFHQRANKYIQSNIAYTWSHSEDLGQGTFSSNYYFSDQGDTYFNGSSIINGKSGYAYEKGSSLEDQRQRIVMTAIMHTPDVTGGMLKKEVVNGWQLAPIFTYGTPQFVDSYLTVGGASVGSGAGQLPASAIPVGNATTSSDARLYYSTPTLSGIGAETPGGSRVPFLPTANLPLGHTVQLDGRLTKIFPIHESQTFEFSFEAINVLNHIRYTGVNQTVYKSIWDSTTNTGFLVQQAPGGASGWGAGTASGGFPDGTNARRAQIALRYTF
jgi:outer membrane receptor protein involved in Fe transport